MNCHTIRLNFNSVNSRLWGIFEENTCIFGRQAYINNK